ncbi:cation:proton antiporter subunit C [Anaplasmataceae bacterium AB001_6]|nr:cation:proton antiporter subunit C [Anaplasmataceae bacterium AB001_6]
MISNIIFAVIFLIFSLSLIIIFFTNSLIKKLVGLNILQLSAIIFYISISYIDNSFSPIYNDNGVIYSNPLPHVLMLTAIVVGVATLALGISMAVKIMK